MVKWIQFEIEFENEGEIVVERAYVKAERTEDGGVAVSCSPALWEAFDIACDAARPLPGNGREPGQVLELPESVAKALHAALTVALSE